MANKKRKLGKVVKQIGGYRIRMEMETRNSYKIDRFGRKESTGSKVCFTGKFGVYAGKNLCKGNLSKEKAVKVAKNYEGID